MLIKQIINSVVLQSIKNSLQRPCIGQRCLFGVARVLSQQQISPYSSSTDKVDVYQRYPYDPNLGDDLPEHVYQGLTYKPGIRVYTWGVAAQGALGRPSFLSPKSKKHTVIDKRINPHRLDFGEKHKVIDVSCGYGFTVFAVKDTNSYTCYGTGLNTDGQLGSQLGRSGQKFDIVTAPLSISVPVQKDERVVKVSCGRSHTLVLTNKGNAYSFGNNIYGQCGRPVVPNEDYSRNTIFTQIKEVEDNVVQIESGQDTSFFLTSSGQVLSCGWGADGQTGRGHYKSEAKVGEVTGDLQGVKIIKVSSRADCALAISDCGEVFGWGNNEYKQLSGVCDEPQLHTPRQLKLPSEIGKIIDVACGGTSCYVLNESGHIFSWGYGTLGRGPANVFSPTPEVIPPTLLGANKFRPDNKVVSISCGVHMTMCLTNNGDVYSWGKNRGGCLGQGHTKLQEYPVKVWIPCSAVKVSCGIDHAVALGRRS